MTNDRSVLNAGTRIAIHIGAGVTRACIASVPKPFSLSRLCRFCSLLPIAGIICRSLQGWSGGISLRKVPPFRSSKNFVSSRSTAITLRPSTSSSRHRSHNPDSGLSLWGLSTRAWPCLTLPPSVNPSKSIRFPRHATCLPVICSLISTISLRFAQRLNLPQR